MIYISRKISKSMFEALSEHGEKDIYDYGWSIIMSNGYADEEDFYDGAYIHSKNGEYEIICRINKA